MSEDAPGNLTPEDLATIAKMIEDALEERRDQGAELTAEPALELAGHDDAEAHRLLAELRARHRNGGPRDDIAKAVAAGIALAMQQADG